MAQILDLEEKRLERLSPRDLVAELMKVPAKKRLELILQRSDAASVVAAMEVRDYYFSVMEIGPDDALPLLAMANVEQLIHLFDLEWWEADRVKVSRAIEWLERIEKANERNLLEWLYKVDFELLVILFKKWIRVQLMPDDTDPVEAREQLPRNTIDDVYFWESLYPQYEDLINRMLSLLFEAHPGFYRELMNAAIWALDPETEEDAYRFHRGRMEDQAIPDFYDALEVYRGIGLREIKADKRPFESPSEEFRPPAFALALIPEGDLLDRALQEVRRQASLDLVQVELAALANKVIVADRLPPEEPEMLRRAVEKTVACVNLGLELLSHGDLAVAVGAVENIHLEQLFRLAQTEIGNLRNRLLELLRGGWLSRWPEGIRCLDGEWLERAELLIRRTPKLLRPASTAGARSGEDFFRREGDLLEAGRFIESVSRIGRLYAALMPDPDLLDRRLWRGGQIGSLAEVTLGSMILTSASFAVLDGQWRLDLIPLERWPVLFGLARPETLRKVIVQWAQTVLPDNDLQGGVLEYLDSVLVAFREDMSGFASSDPPDPRNVPLLLFTQG